MPPHHRRDTEACRALCSKGPQHCCTSQPQSHTSRLRVLSPAHTESCQDACRNPARRFHRGQAAAGPHRCRQRTSPHRHQGTGACLAPCSKPLRRCRCQGGGGGGFLGNPPVLEVRLENRPARRGGGPPRPFSRTPLVENVSWHTSPLRQTSAPGSVQHSSPSPPHVAEGSDTPCFSHWDVFVLQTVPSWQ
jgi:hypothetical protein